MFLLLGRFFLENWITLNKSIDECCSGNRYKANEMEIRQERYKNSWAMFKNIFIWLWFSSSHVSGTQLWNDCFCAFFNATNIKSIKFRWFPRIDSGEKCGVSSYDIQNHVLYEEQGNDCSSFERTNRTSYSDHRINHEWTEEKKILI